MKMSCRLSLLIGLMILGSRTTAMGQSSAGTGAPGRLILAPGVTTSTSRSTVGATRSTTSVQNRASTVRRRSQTSFSRTVTRGGGSTDSGSTAPYAGAAADTLASGSAMGYGGVDPLRPYSPRARTAQSQSTLGSTRRPPRQVVVPQRTTPSYNYYPSMRGSRFGNANVPHRCTPSRGAAMGGGYGHRR